MPDFEAKNLNCLLAENDRLKKALAALICWAGESPDGPAWATEEAKKKNRAMFENALNNACECLPDQSNVEVAGYRN